MVSLKMTSPFDWRKTPTALDMPLIKREQNAHRRKFNNIGTEASPFYRLIPTTGLRDYSKTRDKQNA